MANAKARANRRPAAANGGPAARSARTTAAISATPTSRAVTRPAARVLPEPEEPAATPAVTQRPAVSGQPAWLQVTSFVLAVGGLAISAYETYAHFNGSHLAGCPTGHGTFNCAAVITSPQSMVFGVIPVAVLGLAFYVVAVPLFSPWAWRLDWRLLHLARLLSVIVGMGFVMYLIYAELYQIGQVCEYCTGVHIVTFLLFCITVFSAAIWGLGGERDAAPRA